MKNGWRMKEIDEMDMLGFLRLRAWDATREQEKKKPQQRFIDEDCALFLFRHLFRHAGINREAVKFRMS